MKNSRKSAKINVLRVKAAYQRSVSDSSGDKQCNNLSMALWHRGGRTVIQARPTSIRKKVEGYEASFDFLGYTFQCRKSWNRKQGQCFTNFLPAISKKSVKKLHEKMKEWKLHSHLDWKLQQIGRASCRERV